MNFLFYILFPLFCLSSYETNSLSLDEQQPNWVKAIIKRGPKFAKVTRCTYANTNVWKVNNCITCNDMITRVYDKDKKLICQYGGVLRKNSCLDNQIKMQDCKVIYSPTGL